MRKWFRRGYGADEPPKPKREMLPNKRRSETFSVEVNNMHMMMTVGYYPDGRPGEVFVSNIKSGTTADAMFRDAAIILSVALQHGVPMDVLWHATSRDEDDAPESFIGALLQKLVEDRT